MSSAADSGSATVMSNSSEFPKPLGYNPFPNTLAPYIAAILFETFLYGIYTVLFAVCLYILLKRRKTLHWILPVLASVMFAIATADICYTMNLLFQHLLKGSLTFPSMKPKYWLYVTNNVLADVTLLYRCYVVWGGDWKIMTLPVLLLVTSMVCGYLFEGSSTMLFANSWVYVMLTFILNVVLTGLIAGRIWWLSWKGKKILDRKMQKRYYVAMAAMLESGLLASVYMLPDLILVSIVLDNGFVQVVGIVPTLIVVQVGLGRAVNLDEEAGEDTIAPIAIAELASTTQGQIVSNKDRIISFYSDKPIGIKADDFSRCVSSGSSLNHQDQMRTGEDRLPIEENRREKLALRDMEQGESVGRDPEMASESSCLQISPPELENRDNHTL